ncbi:hypothetical protein, partial [Candidatus Bathycorpusculum sp.]|uniref:hypothetical protein n=1 Tax=Candidatus Bathycorpusculum sp. TaxID=2994959 RepID=UPI0028195085|nr:hypothetical protein [Candidatus Termitimicrobium sp.]MCL2432488.1 hypothetical protein [Candidatus Termitimicrobium sp.]
IPEFTLRFVDNSYDVPPTFSKDPFTGKNEMTQEGYHVENKTAEIKIKNPPFTSYKDSQGNSVYLSYDIRWKGHFDDYWHTRSSIPNCGYLADSRSIGSMDMSGVVTLLDPNALFTEISYSLGETRNYNMDNIDVSEGGQIDFQVQALIGYSTRVEVPPDPVYPRGNDQFVFTCEFSDWSKTQTITMGTSSDGAPTQNEPTPNPTYASNPPHQPAMTIAGINLVDFSLGVVLGVVIAGLSVAFVYEKRKTARYKRDTQTITGT